MASLQNCIICHSAAFLTICLWTLPSTSQTTVSPTTVDLANEAEVLSEVASKVKSAIVLRPKLVIDGDYYATTMLVGAKEIVFKSGSRIILNDATPETAGALGRVAL
jgi:hypothetical protein